jgi:hypothetical protein
MADPAGEEEVPKKGSKNSFFTKYKWYIVGGAVILVVLFVLMAKKGSSSGTSTSSTASPTTAASDLTGIDPSTGIPYADEYGLMNYGGLNSSNGNGGLSTQLSNIQASLNTLTSTTGATASSGTATTSGSSTSTPTYQSLASETESGAGYWGGAGATLPVQSLSGQVYSYISTPQLAAQIPNQFVQSEPGVFTQITPGSNLPANTPIYQQVQAAA